MTVRVTLSFDEGSAVRLLNWLAGENAIILTDRPDLPGLYESGVVYRREKRETWCDYLALLARGHEDCDGLAAARAGELLARGAEALAPGEPGYADARRLGLSTIRAQVLLRTRTDRGRPGLYHCVVRYLVDGREYRDDPSARLGMYNGQMDPTVVRRWPERRRV